jgi:hypothetical protein
MKDLNKSRFEEEWRQAFEEAELPPANDVWSRLDAHLANQESRKYKNRLVWFQRIAAGVLLVLLGGGAWLWIGGQAPGTELAGGPGQTTTTRTGPAMAQAEGSTATGPADATSPSGQATGDVPANGTADATARTQPESRPGTSPDGLARVRPATPGPQSGTTGKRAVGERTVDEEAVGLSTGPALARDRSGTPATSRAGRSARKGTGTLDAYLAHGGRNGKPGANDAGETAAYGANSRIPAKAVPAEEPVAGAVPAAEAADGRLAVTAISPRTLVAQEPVIRTRSILPHLNEAYWAKVVTEDEQVAQKTDAKRDRWQVGLAFAPGAYQPNFRVNQHSPTFMNAVNSYSAANFGNARVDASTLSAANRDLETATAQGLSYQTGVRLEYALSRRLSVQSGVDYLYNSSSVSTNSYVQNALSGRNEPAFASIVNYGNQSRAESLTAADAPPSVEFGSSFNDFTGGRSLNQSASVIPVQNVYKYVGIPVRVNYQLLTRKLGATLGAGVSGDIFLSNRFGNEKAGIDEVHITSTKGTAYRKLGFSAWLGLKMQYRFARKYSVFLEPSYRTALTSFTNTPALQSRPALFGVGTGLQMLF